MIVSLCSLTGMSAALPPMCLSNFRVIGKAYANIGRDCFRLSLNRHRPSICTSCGIKLIESLSKNASGIRIKMAQLSLTKMRLKISVKCRPFSISINELQVFVRDIPLQDAD